MTSKHSAKGSLLILTAALFWSTGGFFIKSIELDAYSISLWRSSIAAITLTVFYLLIVKKDVRHNSSWFNPQILVTSVVYAALLVLFVLATKLTTSANAIFLQFTAPVYVLFFEPIINKTKLKSADIIAVVITIGAMALFFVGQFDGKSVLGNILALSSGIFFACYTLLLKHERTGEAGRWQSVIIGHILIVIAMGLMAMMGEIQPMPHSSNEFLMLLFLGVLQIGVPYSLFTVGIHSVSALDALLLSMVEPVLNPVWVFIGIGEQPSVYALIGGSIILAIVGIRAWLAFRASREMITLET